MTAEAGAIMGRVMRLYVDDRMIAPGTWNRLTIKPAGEWTTTFAPTGIAIRHRYPGADVTVEATVEYAGEDGQAVLATAAATWHSVTHTAGEDRGEIVFHYTTDGRPPTVKVRETTDRATSEYTTEGLPDWLAARWPVPLAWWREYAGLDAGLTVIVNDGQYRWAADRARLVEALAEQGWTESAPGMWEEPPAAEDADSTAAYAALCNAVESRAGEGSTQPLTDDLRDRAGAFTFRPDLGAGTWLLS